MCGRYYIDAPIDGEALQAIIAEVNRRAPEDRVKTAGEVFPTDVVPVICNSRSMKRRVFPMKWGYTLPDGKLLINAKSETAAQKPLFMDGMAHRRCAVPASGYFEWEHAGAEKNKYAIRRPEGQVVYLAGLYRLEGDRPAFVVLTREPAEDIRFIHDRMPVILDAAQLDDWLNPARAAEETLRQAVTSVTCARAEDAGRAADHA